MINVCVLAACCGLDKSQVKVSEVIYTVSTSMNAGLCNKLINLIIWNMLGIKMTGAGKRLSPQVKPGSSSTGLSSY